jgi:REP element-mobilizing transposase RayT
VTYARKSLICLHDTPYYHVVSRCVRRAWLWGFDEYAGKDYSHRKTWVLDRLAELSRVFAIDICAYAVLSNHYHLVLRVDQDCGRRLTAEEVVERWTRLFSRPVLLKRWVQGLCGAAECAAANELIAEWRARLCDVSWYMRCLNEHLARRANAEDHCTGRFWEGRFRSQALLDEAGLLTAMAYVDLNPVRAGIATMPEDSDFTSIEARIKALAAARDPGSGSTDASASLRVPLLKFRGAVMDNEPTIPFLFSDYLELVDWTGRAVRSDKRGAIDRRLPPIMQRLNVDAAAWQEVMRPSGNVFGRALGRLDHLRLHARALGQAWIRGMRQADRLFRHA